MIGGEHKILGFPRVKGAPDLCTLETQSEPEVSQQQRSMKYGSGRSRLRRGCRMRRASSVPDPLAVTWCLLSKGIIVLREGRHGQIQSLVAEKPISKPLTWGCPYSLHVSYNTLSSFLDTPGTFLSIPVFGLGVQRGQESGGLHFLLDLPVLRNSEFSSCTPEERVWRTSQDMSQLLPKIARSISPFRSTVQGEKLSPEAEVW